MPRPELQSASRSIPAQSQSIDNGVEDCSAYHAVSFLNVQDVPQIDDHSDSDRYDGQYTVDLRRPCEGHEGSAREDPNPPIPGEVPTRGMSDAS